MNCIYRWDDTIKEELIYIGKTICFKDRYRAYLTPTPQRHYVIEYMRQYSDWEERFRMTIIEENIPLDSLEKRETYYIEKNNPKCNINKLSSNKKKKWYDNPDSPIYHLSVR